MASVWTHTLDTDSNYAVDNYRAIIINSEISGTGTEIRIKVEARSDDDSVFDGTSIGQRSGSTDDFASAPTRITWDAGNNGTTVSAGTEKWSDWVTFTMDDSVDYLVHFYKSGSNMVMRYDFVSNRGYRATTSQDDTLEQTVSYTIQNTIVWINEIEARTVSAFIPKVIMIT